MRLRKTRRWAEGRPVLVAAMAAQCALMADDAYRLMMALRHSPEFRAAFRIQNAQEWLTLYRRHRFMMRSVLQDWWGSFGIASLSGSIADCVNSFVETGKTPALSLSEERMAEDFVAFARGMADAIWSDLERLLAEREKLTDEDRLEEWRQLSSQEIVFYFRVWFPCWLEYGVSATHLLRDARHGDMQAIDHIFRLDEVTLQDPRIMLQFSEARQDRTRGRFKRMYSAIGNPPDRKLTPKNTKECVGAFISRYSENLGYRISGPDIRRLYDAISQDVRGPLIDMDFKGEEPESFSRAVRRHRPFWEPLFRSGWPLPSGSA